MLRKKKKEKTERENVTHPYQESCRRVLDVVDEVFDEEGVATEAWLAEALTTLALKIKFQMLNL